MSHTKTFAIWRNCKPPRMANRISCLIVILALFSCTKKDNEPDFKNSVPPLLGSLSFSIDGIIHDWKENKNTASSDYLEMAIYPDWGGYTLNAGTNLSPDHPNRLVNLPIQMIAVDTSFTYIHRNEIPNLAIAISTATTPHYNPRVDYRAHQGDEVTVTITRIEDNKAHGTFSAKLTRGSDSSKVDITNGSFKNIRIDQP